MAFSIFVIRKILELFKAPKSLLNLKPKFKTVRQILFTASFINLLKNFTSKFIKFTVRKIRRKVLNLGSKFNRFLSALKSCEI